MPFQNLNIVLFHDSESEEFLEEPLDTLVPSCYNESDVVIKNIDEFIHVGIHKWYVIYYGLNGCPIYDIEGNFQSFPLEKPYVIPTNSYVWKHEDDMITYFFQPPRDNLLQHSHDVFRSYLGGLIHNILSNWIYYTNKGFNHRCALILMRVKALFSQSRIFVIRVSNLLLSHLVIPL
jgi:hypothetical protein